MNHEANDDGACAPAEALRWFESSRSIVTVSGDGGPVGLLPSSCAAASVDPPLILMCIPRSAASFGIFQSAQSFGVSLLADAQSRAVPLGGLIDFAQSSSFHVEPGPAGGTPLVRGATVQLECATYDRHAAGDHMLLVGEVVWARIDPSRRSEDRTIDR